MTTAQGTRSKRATAIIMPALIAFSMGQTVLFAVLGPVARDIGLSEFQVGSIISATAVVFVFASPIWGHISDRWGRKKVMVFGLTSYGIISILFALAMQSGLDGILVATTAFFVLLGLRISYAVLGGGIQPAATGLMADLSDKENRSAAVALVGASFGLGSVLGPASAAVLVGFGLLAPLYVIAGFGLLMAFVAIKWLPEASPEKDRDDNGQSFSLLSISPLLLIAFCLFTVVSSLQQTVAFYVQDFLEADTMTTAQMTGYCFMSLALASLVVQGGIIQKLKPAPSVLLLLGFPVFLLGLWLYSVPGEFWHLLVAMALMGAGFGAVYPGVTAAVSLATGVDDQGKAAGFVQSAASVGFIFGPLLGTGLYEISSLYTIYMAAGFLVAGLAISTLSLRKNRVSIVSEIM